MVARRIECIERALEQMFRRVLHSCEGEPPQLKEVVVTRDDRNYGMRIRAQFSVQGQPDHWSETILAERDWQEQYRFEPAGFHGRGNRFLYDAGTLWSRLYEDHYIERMRQAARTQALEAVRNGGAPDYEFYSRLENIDRLTQHMRANHSSVMGLDLARGPDMTATEVRALEADWSRRNGGRLQEAVQRAANSLARQTEEHIMRTLGIDPNAQSNTTGDSDGSTLTVESFRQAARALAQNSQHDTWREAFVWDRVNDAVLFGSTYWITPNIEVGTKEAQERGLSLLKENLTPEQLKDYETHKRFDVRGGESGKTYRIKHGRQMNIDVLDKAGNRDYGLCFLPVGGLVAGDCMLAQKTALELCETEALKIANRFQ